MTDRAALLAWLLELIVQATAAPADVQGVVVAGGNPRTGDEAIEVLFRGKRFDIRVDEVDE